MDVSVKRLEQQQFQTNVVDRAEQRNEKTVGDGATFKAGNHNISANESQ